MLNTKRNVALAIVLFSAIALPGFNLQAQDLGNGWGPTPLEITKMPNYCQAYFLKKQLPPNCDGVHHLCAGKVLINRTMDYSIPKRERQRILGQAKKEVDYIFTRKNPRCAMMGEAQATQRQIVMLESFLR